MLRKRESLTSQIVRELTRKIDDKIYELGQQIPTEAELCEEFGVSRTVIREAIASLRSDGLLVSRQGIGVFVSSRTRLPPFDIEPPSPGKLTDIINILELRVSVEVEAAGLAAERSTAKQLKLIEKRLKAMELELGGDEAERGHADFEFHCEIARATNNPYFEKFINFIGPLIIPRLRFSAPERKEDKDLTYLKQIRTEHRNIVDAIEARDSEAARLAMREHLRGSLDRYKMLRKDKKLVSAGA
ncbi:FadR/GntR family transcriptional regulator [Aquamicrobium defluvii]|uniref:GntR family transcriptional regulator n=1 Tax=Aquamicrobium defluvii TaxID=69279 RepID=A0A011V1A9_9HYPH|nr:FadR/GntR family transcriptional regulator [Aquamicrobium defluvii]EXL02220.1 GntR family transcriptional regulator [Aquamicrobium defluvii]EZQ12979.1 GntR family transcriptional regulator [Halopseudomonas bauzanensis]